LVPGFAAIYLATMAIVVLPAYLGASTAPFDLVSLGWLLAGGTVVPLGLGVIARRVARHALTAAAAGAEARMSVAAVETPAHREPTPNLDLLTGLRPYAEFTEELDRQVALATEGMYPLSVAILDVDGLAALNRELGQEAGDRLLAGIGRLVATGIRSDDFAFRIGGDEVAIIMCHCAPGRAQSVVRRLLLAALGEGEASPDGREWSFSAGVSSYPELSASAEALRRDAAAAGAWAKGNGRTDVQLFDAFRHVSEDQRRGDEAASDGAVGSHDDFTSGEHDGRPIQLGFLPAERAAAPEEWVDPRLVAIGLAEAPARVAPRARRHGRQAAPADDDRFTTALKAG
jgi:diguanylate cyclase (GGDEF)-like protein